MNFASRWVVLRKFSVAPGDLDSDGVVRAEAIDRWLAETRDAYLEKCVVLRELRERSASELRVQIHDAPAPARFGRPTAVIVGAGATEIRPTSLTIAFRLRPIDGDGDDAIDAACEASLENPETGEACELGNDIRDELIALEHAAAHVI
jgi:acyl-CoA thioesterase FadM